MQVKNLILSVLLVVLLLAPKPVQHQNPTVNETKVSELKKQITCLTEAIWFEARNQGQQGIDAVYSVIINRTKSGRYPKTFCGVIKQPYQFSFRNKIKYNISINIVPSSSTEKQLLEEIQYKSILVVMGKFKQNLPEDVLFYHNQEVKPNWSKKFEEHSKINEHIFYRMKKG